MKRFAFLSLGAVFIDIVEKVFFNLSPSSQAQLTRDAYRYLQSTG